MPKKLDRSRGYGEVMGHEGGACFEQDNTLFDADGVELFNDEAPAVKPKAPAVKPKAPAVKPKEPDAPVTPAEDQLAQQLEGGEGGLES